MERLTHYYNGEVAEPYNRTEALNMARKLADYEDAEESGLLVRLLCKAGDTLYIHGCGIEEWKVNGLSLSYVTHGEIHSCPISIIKSSIGKTVFLTREDAEQALKKGEK